MFEFIDIYCERIGQGLWAEPLNAITNFAFIIAGIAALELARKQSALSDWRAGTLVFLIFAMGVGSTLFHTFAVTWAMLCDVLPILTFQLVYINAYSQRIMGMKCTHSSALLGLFIAMMWGFMQLPGHWLNGSEYAPALIFVTAFGIWHLKHARHEKWSLLAAAAVFTLSMSLRSLDMAVCPAFPLGTHFLWHILNACVLYLTTRAYVLSKSTSL